MELKYWIRKAQKKMFDDKLWTTCDEQVHANLH